MGKSSARVANREQVNQQSAAEFFSENQQIAGFDNPGKSLFTTIRELVENSLDACESIGRLPCVQVDIVEYTETEHNKLHGIKTHLSPVKTAVANDDTDTNNEYSRDDGILFPDSQTSAASCTQSSAVKVKKALSAAAIKRASKEDAKLFRKAENNMYYRICCRDNGCGIPEQSIGDSLGRVLSGSKHGVRQTRGKFGLGAKMALIWSRKSSGLPIEVLTAHVTSNNAEPSPRVRMVLDIDIYKNTPKILKVERKRNEENWSGLELTLTIGGNFGSYRTKVLQYFQQLAVITPYADLVLNFTSGKDSKKSFNIEFNRRSDQMPPLATEVQPHPHSLNNITLGNFIRHTNAAKVAPFLCRELSGVTPAVAANIVKQTNLENRAPQSLSSAQIAALTQRLRDEKGIRDPNANCLSPAGEYNLRLGIVKELAPGMVATYTEKSGAHEGHPFLIEAAVSVGGKSVAKGVNVYRFANRIPLLFEVGADVVTQVATKQIKWENYYINSETDRVGVFVSIVATRIPFKGTSKEYVGEDVQEIKASVKKCLQMCCLSLKMNLAREKQRKVEQDRMKQLVKYIPDISRSLFTVLKKMCNNENRGVVEDAATKLSETDESKRRKTIAAVANGSLLEGNLAENLTKVADRFEAEAALATLQMENANANKSSRVPLFISPTAPLPSMDHSGWRSVLGTDGHVKVLFGYNYPSRKRQHGDDQPAVAETPALPPRPNSAMKPVSDSATLVIATNTIFDPAPALAPASAFPSKRKAIVLESSSEEGEEIIEVATHAQTSRVFEIDDDGAEMEF